MGVYKGADALAPLACPSTMQGYDETTILESFKLKLFISKYLNAVSKLFQNSDFIEFQ